MKTCKIAACTGIFALAALFLSPFGSVASAGDPVDLRDKVGVIDPKDLKKHDPPERSLKIKEPPTPPSSSEPSPPDVSVSAPTIHMDIPSEGSIPNTGN